MAQFHHVCLVSDRAQQREDVTYGVECGQVGRSVDRVMDGKVWPLFNLTAVRFVGSRGERVGGG